MKNARRMTKLREGVQTKDKRGMQTKAILVLGMGAGLGFSRAKTESRSESRNGLSNAGG